MSKYIYLLFFAVSLILSVMLFYQLADTVTGKIVMVMAATAFEIGKIYLWKKYKNKQSVTAFITCMLFVGLSVVASISFTVGLMKRQYMTVETSGVIKQDIVSLDTQIQELTDTMNDLRPEYITSRLKLSARVEELREIKATKMTEAYSPTKISEAATVFKDLGSVFHVDPVTVMFIFFGAFSILLEAGALLLYVPGGLGEETESGEEAVKTGSTMLKQFAEALYKGDNEPLNGMAKTASEMGIRERQARRMFEILKEKGLIDIKGKCSYPVESFIDKVKGL